MSSRQRSRSPIYPAERRRSRRTSFDDDRMHDGGGDRPSRFDVVQERHGRIRRDSIDSQRDIGRRRDFRESAHPKRSNIEFDDESSYDNRRRPLAQRIDDNDRDREAIGPARNPSYNQNNARTRNDDRYGLHHRQHSPRRQNSYESAAQGRRSRDYERDERWPNSQDNQSRQTKRPASLHFDEKEDLGDGRYETNHRLSYSRESRSPIDRYRSRDRPQPYREDNSRRPWADSPRHDRLQQSTDQTKTGIRDFQRTRDQPPTRAYPSSRYARSGIDRSRDNGRDREYNDRSLSPKGRYERSRGSTPERSSQRRSNTYTHARSASYRTTDHHRGRSPGDLTPSRKRDPSHERHQGGTPNRRPYSDWHSDNGNDRDTSRTRHIPADRDHRDDRYAASRVSQHRHSPSPPHHIPSGERHRRSPAGPRPPVGRHDNVRSRSRTPQSVDKIRSSEYDWLSQPSEETFPKDSRSPLPPHRAAANRRRLPDEAKVPKDKPRQQRNFRDQGPNDRADIGVRVNSKVRDNKATSNDKLMPKPTLRHDHSPEPQNLRNGRALDPEQVPDDKLKAARGALQARQSMSPELADLLQSPVADESGTAAASRSRNGAGTLVGQERSLNKRSQGTEFEISPAKRSKIDHAQQQFCTPESIPTPHSLRSRPVSSSKRMDDRRQNNENPNSMVSVASKGTEEQSVYERIGQVGEGTYGKVYKARHSRTNELVALKKIRLEQERDGFPITSMREIKLLQRLRHPGVVRLLEMMVERGAVFMVFEYMDHDLTGILSNTDIAFEPPHIKDLASQLFDGLAYLHHRGVLHRDMKGSNILLNNAGQLKLADFGLARFYHKRQLNADYTNRVITLWFRPPELLLGATAYDAAVDVWSAGCIFVELFTKSTIFPGRDEIHQIETIYQVVGSPSEESWPGVSALPWYELIKFRTYESKFDTLYNSVLSPAALELGQQILQLDPAKRPLASDILEHPYFTSELPKAERRTLFDIAESHEWDSQQRRRKERAKRQKEEKERGQREAVSGGPSTSTHT